jgi:hypothetical protein
MTDLLTSLAQEWSARRPWLDPPDHKRVAGVRNLSPRPRHVHRLPGGGRSAVRERRTAVPPVPPIDDLIDPAWIERAQRMVLVYADDPGRPCDEGDLPYLTAPARVRASQSEQQAETVTPAGLSGCPRHQADRQPRTANPTRGRPAVDEARSRLLASPARTAHAGEPLPGAVIQNDSYAARRRESERFCSRTNCT